MHGDISTQEKLLSDRCMGCGLDSRGGVPPAWSPAVERRLGERTCPSADGRWRALTCHRQVIHHAPFKSFSIVKAKNKVSERIPCFLVRVKGLEPSRSCPHKNLNLTRLPIPPHPHMIITHCCEIIFINRQSSFFFSRQSVA